MKRPKRTKRVKDEPIIVYYESHNVEGLTEDQVRRFCQTIAAMPFSTRATIN